MQQPNSLPMLVALASLLICFPAGFAEEATFIKNGGPAKRGEFPYSAVVLRNGYADCGGALISRYHVLTASHCINPIQANYSVILGDHDLTVYEESEQRISVVEIRFHPDSRSDLAILVLETPATLNSRVQVISISNTDVRRGRGVTALGWGWTHFGWPSVLQRVFLPVQTADVCTEDGIRNVTDSVHICAGYTGFRRYVNVCHGDSGAPLVIKSGPRRIHQLVGVVQRGHDGCPDNKRMALFARIKTVRGWVLESMKTVAGGVPVEEASRRNAVPSRFTY